MEERFSIKYAAVHFLKRRVKVIDIIQNRRKQTNIGVAKKTWSGHNENPARSHLISH